MKSKGRGRETTVTHLRDPADAPTAASAGGGRFLKVAEVARIARCSTAKVYRLVAAGSLPARRFGRTLLVRRRDLADFLKPVEPLAVFDPEQPRRKAPRREEAQRRWSARVLDEAGIV